MSTHADRLQGRLSRILPDLPVPLLPDVHPKIGLLLAGARTAFSLGFQQALRARPDALSQLLRDEPFQTRGFALEGAAMAVVLLDEADSTHRRRLEALLTGRSVAEKALCAIGVGWASARLGRSLTWLPPGLEQQYRSSVVDGYGFHQGFFHSHRFEGRGFPLSKSELSASYDVGLGRALWFVYLGRVKAIVSVIDRMPPGRRMELWRGIGAACAFTGSTEYAAAQLAVAAAELKSHFCSGIETGIQLLSALARSTKEDPP